MLAIAILTSFFKHRESLIGVVLSVATIREIPQSRVNRSHGSWIRSAFGTLRDVGIFRH